MMAGCAAKRGLADRAQEIVAQCLTGQPGATVNKSVAKMPFNNARDNLHPVECPRVAGVRE